MSKRKKADAAPTNFSSTPVKVCIPTIGTKLRLTKNWTFVLYAEGRNWDFGARVGARDEDVTSRWKGGWKGEQNQITLPKGTILTVDRIYIRHGARDFDSITLRIVKGDCPTKTIWGRFWAKLGDMNRVVCEWDQETVRTDTKVDLITQLGGIASATETE